MATVELAVAIPALVAFLVLLLAMVDVVRTQVQCEHAARGAVRMVARGDESAAALDLARRLGPPQAIASITDDGRLVEVVVRARPRGAVLLGLPAQVRAVSSAVREDVGP